jgi:hypothetical protein
VSLFATAADFEQGGLYGPDPYHEYPFFQERVDELIGRFAPNGQKLLVVGCGYGYLVDLCVTAGYDAFGVDNTYAITKGRQLLPAISTRLLVADALNTSTLDTAAKSAGLHGGVPKWALLVTEDVLPCMSDAEIATALTNLRARCSTNLLHFVTPGQQDASHDPRINWKTIDAWRAVLCPPDVAGDCETGLFWNAAGQV